MENLLILPSAECIQLHLRNWSKRWRCNSLIFIYKQANDVSSCGPSYTFQWLVFRVVPLRLLWSSAIKERDIFVSLSVWWKILFSPEVLCVWRGALAQRWSCRHVTWRSQVWVVGTALCKNCKVRLCTYKTRSGPTLSLDLPHRSRAPGCPGGALCMVTSNLIYRLLSCFPCLRYVHAYSYSL